MIENIPNINFPMNSKSDKNARKRANSIEKPEKRPRGNSIDVSHVHSLTLGAEIVIRATESVVQKCPQLVGSIAYIKEVPVHPATWFKVSLADGTVHTFRPSALRLKSQPEEYIASSTSYPALKNPNSSISSSQHPLHPRQQQQQQQQQQHKTITIGMKVKIIKGQFQGLVASVINIAKGWTQLVSKYGNISKRCTDIEPITVDVDSAADEDLEQECNSNDFQNLLDYKIINGDHLNVKNPKSHRPLRSIKPNRLYSNNQEEQCVNNLNLYTCSKESQKRKRNSICYECDEYPLPHDNDSTDSKNDDEDEVDNNNKKKNYHVWRHLSLPRLNENVLKARRQVVRKYVKRNVDMIVSRPDLRYWQYEINPVLTNLLCPKNTCDECNREKWVGGKYCWNSECSKCPSSTLRNNANEINFISPVNKQNFTISKKTFISHPIEDDVSTARNNVPTPIYDDNFPDSLSLISGAKSFSKPHHHPMKSRLRADSLSYTDIEMNTPERIISDDEISLEAY